jgi:hypothetical protein
MATRENRETDISIVVGRSGTIRRRERRRYGKAIKPRKLLFPNYLLETQRPEHVRKKGWLGSWAEREVGEEIAEQAGPNAGLESMAIVAVGLWSREFGLYNWRPISEIIWQLFGAKF